MSKWKGLAECRWGIINFRTPKNPFSRPSSSVALSAPIETLFPPDPEEEDDAVEEVFQHIFVQQVEPLGAVRHNHREQRDAPDIDEITGRHAHRHKPQLVLPRAARCQQNAGEDEHLFQARTAPNDVNAVAVGKVHGGVCECEVVAQPAENRRHHSGNVCAHRKKRRRDVAPEKGNHIAALVAENGEFPQKMRHQQHHHKPQHAAVRLTVFFKFGEVHNRKKIRWLRVQTAATMGRKSRRLGT